MEPIQQENSSEPERFVDAVVAAKFLSIERRQLLELARSGKMPAYPIGDGRLSALAISAFRSREGDGAKDGSGKENQH